MNGQPREYDIPPVLETAPGPNTMRIQGDLSPDSEFSHQRFNTDAQAFETVEKPQFLGSVATSRVAEILAGANAPAEAEPAAPPMPDPDTGSLARNFLANVLAESAAETAAAARQEESRQAVQAEISEAATSRTGAEYLADILANAELEARARDADSREEFVPHSSAGAEPGAEPGPAPGTELTDAKPVEAIPDTPYLREQLNRQSLLHPAMPEDVRTAPPGVRKKWLINQGMMNNQGEFIEANSKEGRPASAAHRLRRLQ